ncbi:MAG: FAD-binding protein [Proteobacteria bacterium]|nr:FAD-binding protein [Desulfobacula sp.]MBU3952436.1 FAD-binding protein [Pseudomonadota bacterium]MBU4133646.1 FAD-binding protein [Pseudomonadota bacterium]
MVKLKTDILVIGAGLAGIRAALAAKEADPDAHVVLASFSAEPHGSSFSNVHNRLGIQVCQDDDEKKMFTREAISIAPPGEINPNLVKILADESCEAFQDLRQWGAKIKRDSSGLPVRVRGCFSPVQARANILMDMDHFFYKLKKRLEDQGVDFMPGWQAEDVLTEGEPGRSRALGAVLKKVGSIKKKVWVYSKAVILASGGSAAAYRMNLSGAGKASLILHDWCDRHGLEYVNKAYTQFVWCKADDFGDWSILNLSGKEACFRDSTGKIRAVPEHFGPLFETRKTHAPMAYGFKDRAIDQLLVDNLDAKGRIEVFHPDTGWMRVVLAAQVSNGGIRVDQNGRTRLSGLFACGECAGGMHGANRLGGAMVLAGQVFGKRAGISAAMEIGR